MDQSYYFLKVDAVRRSRTCVDLLQFLFLFEVQEIHEGLNTLRQMVSDLENKQKTVLGVALPEDGKSCLPTALDFYSCSRTWLKGGREQSSACKLKLFSVSNMLLFRLGMKRELQTLREEIKTLAGQIQGKLKSEFSLTSCVSSLGLNLYNSPVIFH